MNKRQYQKPIIKVRSLSEEPLMAASETSITINPNETLDNDQALAKPTNYSVWGDDEEE